MILRQLWMVSFCFKIYKNLFDYLAYILRCYSPTSAPYAVNLTIDDHRFKYAYSLHGLWHKTYTKNRFIDIGGSTNNRAHWRKYVWIGTLVTCYINHLIDAVFASNYVGSGCY